MSTELSKAQQREAFVSDVAPTIASKVGAVVGSWSSAMPLSTFFGWFQAPDALVMVGCPNETQRDVDLGLAYGLAHMADRELILILPEGTDEPTRRRLPWIDAAVDLRTFNTAGDVSRSPRLSRAEVLAACNDLVVTAIHQLGERSNWIERLTAWADDCPELVAAHRSSYLAWHCRGRMVLKIRKIAGGLAATAGVHSNTTDRAPHNETLAKPIDAGQFHRITAAASDAIADRLGGLDVANAEHQLQEQLARTRSKLNLRLTLREFPAMRPVDNRGYIDLLGVGHDNALHVVETKIGADPMLVLQGLDYWVWAMAHRSELVTHLNSELDAHLADLPKVVLDFVVAERDGKLLSAYSAAQLQALDGSVGWRMFRIDDWDTADTFIKPYGRRVPKDAPRVSEPSYPVRIEAELIARAGTPMVRRVFFGESGGGILSHAKQSFALLQTRGLLHPFVDQVRSSQAFALNLFGGLSTTELSSVWRFLGVTVTEHEGIELEYVDPLDALAESQPSRPHQTQVDVLLRARSAGGERHVALIEVKLSETAFGSCSAFDADENDRRAVCHQAGAWGGDRNACFQLRNHDGPRRRAYDMHLQPGWISDFGDDCPFQQLNQPMRNVALARAILDRGDADTATFALCAPTANTAVWRQWRRSQQVFAKVPNVSLRDLSAEQLLGAMSVERRESLIERYGLATVPG